MTSVIYETRGKAREYSELAANLYSGCGHGCTYCYAPSATFKKREQFYGNPHPRKNVIKQFEKDCIALRKAGETRPVLLSFTTDPYQPIDSVEKLTRRAIQLLHQNNLSVSILTKGGRRSERDFGLLMDHPELSQYGATLVFTDEALRREIEPGAAPTRERIESLELAHSMGIPTFVSLEPVWDPEQTLQLIAQTVGFVDLYKVGKLNYSPVAKTIDWGGFGHAVVEMLEKHNKKYYIKKDLAALM
jgi:DNA repair photolyase